MAAARTPQISAGVYIAVGCRHCFRARGALLPMLRRGIIAVRAICMVALNGAITAGTIADMLTGAVILPRTIAMAAGLGAAAG